MRNAINNNPIVQIGLLAGLAILVAVMFMSSMGGGGSSTPPEDTASTDTAAAAPAAAAALAADGATVTEPAGVAPAVVPPSASTEGGGFEASKGLPAELVSSYESGEVVVLLVMQGKGIEDKSLERDVEKLEADGNTSVFVTDAKDVAKYSRIAEGVTLDRVPAIIVLHPLEGKLAKGELAQLPAASVSYGYRGPESVRQTVQDVLYDGKQLAYDPG